MRMMCGLMGVAVVPMAYYTIKNSGHSLHASILAAVLVLFGKGLVLLADDYWQIWILWTLMRI